MKLFRLFILVEMLLCFSLQGQSQLNDTLVKFINKRLSQYFSLEAVVVTQSQMSANGLYLKGVQANSDKDYVAAIQHLRQAVEIDSFGNCGSGMNGAAFNELGYAYTRLFKKDSALYCLDRSILFNPAHPKAYVNKAFLLLNLKRKDDAILTLDALIIKSPEFLAALPLRGWLHQQAGREEEARKDYKHYLALKPVPGKDEEEIAIHAWLQNMSSEAVNRKQE